MFGGVWRSSTLTIIISAIVEGASAVAGPTDPIVPLFSRIVLVAIEAIGFGFRCDDVPVLTRRHLSGERSSLTKKPIHKE